MTRSYYASVLGISPEAGEAEIKAAYRRLAKKFHPDVNPEPKARERFIELKKAYDFLLQTPAQTQRYYATHPAQKREEDEKRKREIRMKRAREMRIQKEEAERQAWEKFVGSAGMWVVVFVILTIYFSIVGICINNIMEYPYEGQNVSDPEISVGGSVVIIAAFTFGLYRFYYFLRR